MQSNTDFPDLIFEPCILKKNEPIRTVLSRKIFSPTSNTQSLRFALRKDLIFDKVIFRVWGDRLEFVWFLVLRRVFSREKD